MTGLQFMFQATSTSCLESLQPLLQSPNLGKVCETLCENAQRYFHDSDNFLGDYPDYAIQLQAIKATLSLDNSLKSKLVLLYEIFDKLGLIKKKYCAPEFLMFKMMPDILTPGIKPEDAFLWFSFMIQMNLLDLCIECLESITGIEKKDNKLNFQYKKEWLKKRSEMTIEERYRFDLVMPCLLSVSQGKLDSLDKVQDLLESCQFVKTTFTIVQTCGAFFASLLGFTLGVGLLYLAFVLLRSLVFCFI